MRCLTLIFPYNILTKETGRLFQETVLKLSLAINYHGSDQEGCIDYLYTLIVKTIQHAYQPSEQFIPGRRKQFCLDSRSSNWSQIPDQVS